MKIIRKMDPQRNEGWLGGVCVWAGGGGGGGQKQQTQRCVVLELQTLSISVCNVIHKELLIK